MEQICGGNETKSTNKYINKQKLENILYLTTTEHVLKILKQVVV